MDRATARGRARLWRTVVAEVGFTLVTAGMVLLAFVAYDLWGTSLAERHDQALLARQFQAAVAGGAKAPTGAGTRGAGAQNVGGSDSPTVGGVPATAAPQSSTTVGPGAAGSGEGSGEAGTGGGAASLPVPGPGIALARIVIPAIGVDRYVVQGVDEADLQMGPGHYPGTPMPGQPGNVAIAGHRTTFGAPFFELGHLVTGDMIYLTGTSGWTWAYRVQRLFSVDPTDVGVLERTSSPELTLTTCTPPFEATQRLVVRAALAGRAKPGADVFALPKRTARAANANLVIAAPPARSAKSDKTTATTVAASTQGKAGSGRHHPGTCGKNAITPDRGTVVPVPVPHTQDAVAGAVLWGIAAASVWLAARLLAYLWPRRSRRALQWSTRRRHGIQAGTLVLGAAVACVPLWSCFANVVQLLPANF